MSDTPIHKMITDLLEREGGYVNHPADKGGPTKYGITLATYANYFKIPQHDCNLFQIERITPELAENIYLKLYHVRPGIAFLPGALRPLMLDMAVNHGPMSAIKILQHLLNDNRYDSGAADGIIGAQTLMAANNALDTLGDSLISSLVDRRIRLYRKIIAADPSQKVFQNGWFARAEAFRPEAVA